MAVSLQSRLPQPRAVSVIADRDDSGTGTGGSSTSNTSTASGGSASSGSLRDKIRRFFNIPSGSHGAGRSRIPRPSTGHQCDVIRRDAALEKKGSKQRAGGGGGGNKKPRVRFADNDKIKDRKRSSKTEAGEKRSDSGCSSEDDKRTKYKKADEKFVPHHKTRTSKRKGKLLQAARCCSRSETYPADRVSGIQMASMWHFT
ncbi:hypothetical protein LSH36_84g00069 [Paralvinella palmiformis]|uniref:Uncharacterized protein n=1 Tax=Paralvinella palmiformis TaxID=53620 RepID=A0AAD9NCH0_9ANNE|nr:hypothetical protein LSH36_84g00069 [Paralvinella palmiformis]